MRTPARKRVRGWCPAWSSKAGGHPDADERQRRDAARFWAKVDRSGPPGSCWTWTASRRGGLGYGSYRSRGRLCSAHRFSWQLVHGQVPDGICVLHRCDVPSCVNPAHLFLGTHRDNTNDKVAKGRQARVRGERHGLSKLTAPRVIEIRARLALGANQYDLASAYGVSQPTISQVARGVTWRHVGEVRP